MLAVAFVFLHAGCAYNYSVPDFSLRSQGTEYALDQKIDLSINLCLSNDFRATKWQKKIVNDTYTIDIGGQLAKNATEMSDILFKKVIHSKTPIANATHRVDAILTPKVVAIERSYGATSLGESILLVVLEWRLEDNYKNVIWIDAIKAMGRAPTGNIYNHKKHAQNQVLMLLKNLFSQSFQSAREAIEIRQYVARKPPLSTVEASTNWENPAGATFVTEGGNTVSTLAEGVLTETQIRRLFANKTVDGIHNKKGFRFTRVFYADGALSELSSNKGRRKGHWSVNQNELCIEWKNGKTKCRELIKDNGVIKQYKIKKSGKRVLDVTYETFLDGTKKIKNAKRHKKKKYKK